MKKYVITLTASLFLSLSFAQIIETFSFLGAANANGWTTHSGTTPGQVQTINSPSNNGNSLSFLNLVAPIGNRVQLIAGNSEDVNKAVVNLGTSAYYSFLLNVPTTAGLHINANAGDYFIGLGATAGSPVTSLGARVFIKAGSTPNSFVLGLTNNSGGGTNTTWNPTEYPCGTTVFVVVKLNIGASPIASSMWINPTPGSIEPVSTILNSSGSNAMVALASIYLRQSGTALAGTGTLEIDEIRAGNTWASVTPAGAIACVTYNSISATACTSYTLNAQTYNTTGNFVQTLPNANSQGCDSIINLNLTINNTSSAVLTVNNCGPYTLNGQTYSTTGTYSQLTTNVNGCDSAITLNLAVVSSLSYYQDFDGDGFGNAAVSQIGCNPIVGYVTNNTDCNDLNNAVYPGAIEIPGNGIDEDCDGVDAPAVPLMIGLYEFTAAANCPVTSNLVTAQPPNALFSPFTNMGVTCSPTANVFSASTWNQSNTIDLNQYNEFSIVADTCVALNLSSVAFNHRTSATGGAPTWILRASLDNFTTNIGSGLSGNNGNVMLDDTVALPISFSGISQVTFRIYLTNIGAAGSTWRMDNVSLYGSTTPILPQLFYADADGDGYGDAAVSLLACSAPANYVANNTDCNDLDSLINPLTVWFVDFDMDGYGNPNNFVTGCLQPPGTAINGFDCDDTNNQLNLVDMYYVDADGDGFGDDATGVEQCVQPANTVTIGGDCDDADSTIFPGATEICDGFDNNCNGVNDEGLIFNTYFVDADNDNFGTGVGESLCEDPGVGYVLVGGDCDDADSTIYPGATEILDNGIDENCDGVDNYLSVLELAEINVNLYPNPSNGLFILDLQAELANSKLFLLDLSGKIVFEVLINGKSVVVDASNLLPGCYVVRIENEKSSIVKRLIISN